MKQEQPLTQQKYLVQAREGQYWTSRSKRRHVPERVEILREKLEILSKIIAFSD